MNEFYDYSVNLSTVWITVNRACNFRCKWCYAECSEYKIDDDMSLELARKIVDVSKEAGAKHVILIGGEPTMWKHVFDLSDYCKEQSISCGMVTNACLFGDDSYYEKFLRSPFASVGLSIKGITKKQFENVVGNRALYQQTIIGLKRLLNYYSNMGVSVVYSNIFNHDDLLEIASIARDMGAKIDSKGYVLPCNSMIDVKLGKIGEDFSTGEELLEMLGRKEIMDGYKAMLRYPSNECDRCDYNDYCRGGCIVNWTVLDSNICHAIIKPERG